MNKDIEQKINNVLETFINDNKLFTAFDVSKEVKKDFPFVRHSEVKELVHYMYNCLWGDMGTFVKRTSINITRDDGSLAKAWLYHPSPYSADVVESLYQEQQKSTVPSVVDEEEKMASAATLPKATATISITIPVSDPKELWAKLFGNNNLFPLV